VRYSGVVTEFRGISMLVLRPLALSMARLGISPEMLLGPLGVTLDSDRETRVPAGRVMAVVDELARTTGIDHLGLSAARQLPLGALGFLDYSVSSSATLRQALDRAARYITLIFDGLSFEMREADGVLRVIQRYEGMPSRRHAVEFTTALFVDRARELVGPEMTFRAACFAHPAPRDTREHAQALGLEPSFGARFDELQIPTALLTHSLWTGDRAVSELLEQYGRRLFGRVASRDPLLDRLRNRVADDLPNGRPDLVTLAAALGMAPRTLQRKLRERGTSCSEIVDELRREIATELVASGESPLTIAFRLGFGDATAFYRAFKRWNGTTPGAFRSQA
jgi:AraC-like DNA-binding protein